MAPKLVEDPNGGVLVGHARRGREAPPPGVRRSRPRISRATALVPLESGTSSASPSRPVGWSPLAISVAPASRAASAKRRRAPHAASAGRRGRSRAKLDLGCVRLVPGRVGLGVQRAEHVARHRRQLKRRSVDEQDLLLQADREVGSEREDAHRASSADARRDPAQHECGCEPARVPASGDAADVAAGREDAWRRTRRDVDLQAAERRRDPCDDLDGHLARADARPRAPARSAASTISPTVRAPTRVSELLPGDPVPGPRPAAGAPSTARRRSRTSCASRTRSPSRSRRSRGARRAAPARRTGPRVTRAGGAGMLRP